MLIVAFCHFYLFRMIGRRFNTPAQQEAIQQFRGLRTSRPWVANIGPDFCDVEWRFEVFEQTHNLSFCVSYQVGGEGAWHVAIQDTHMASCTARVDGLKPLTWYSFRVSPVHPEFGTGRGSAPSEPRRTLKSDKRPVEIAREERRARPSVVSAEIGKGAAAAMVVARGAEVTPPPSEEQSAYAAAAAAHALDSAMLRKALVEWDDTFALIHNRAPTDAERANSPRRVDMLAQYEALRKERERFGAIAEGEEGPLSEALREAPDFALTNAGSLEMPADSRRWRQQQRQQPQQQPSRDGSQRRGGGAMFSEKARLASRLTAEARGLYMEMVIKRCWSLSHVDAISTLSSNTIDAAVQLFAQFDHDIDGMLSQTEFAALYASLASGSHSSSTLGTDWQVAFRRADVSDSGYIDLNAMIEYLRACDAMDVIGVARRADAESAGAGGAEGEGGGLHCRSLPVRSSVDLNLLSDSEYLELLVEQAQSVGSSFELDRISDHRLLIRALRIFRKHDKQRRGTMSLVEFQALVAPLLEGALARGGKAQAAVRGLHEEERRLQKEREQAHASLGTAYARLASEAARVPSSTWSKVGRSSSSPARSRIAAPAGSGGVVSSSSSSVGGSGGLVDGSQDARATGTGALAKFWRSKATETEAAVGGAIDKLSALPGVASALALECLGKASDAAAQLTDGKDSRVQVQVVPRGAAAAAATRITIPTEQPHPSTSSAVASAVDRSDASLRMHIRHAALDLSRTVFSAADTTSSGALDFNEFVALLAGGALPRAVEESANGANDHLLEGFWGTSAITMRELEQSRGVGGGGGLGGGTGADDSPRRKVEEQHRGLLVDRVVERLNAEGSKAGSAEEVLTMVNEPRADDAVRIFMRADTDFSGGLTISEFTSALATASEESVYSTGRRPGAMEAKLWFAALDGMRRGYVDVCQWLDLLWGKGVEGESGGKGIVAGSFKRRDPTSSSGGLSAFGMSPLRGAASAAARASLSPQRMRARGTDTEEAHRQVAASVALLEGGEAEGWGGGGSGEQSPGGTPYSSPVLTSVERKRVLKGLTAAAEAAEDAAFEEVEAQRARTSAERREVEDDQLHAYLSKLVSATNSSRPTSEGFQLLESFSAEELAAALSLFARFDSDADGRLQQDEFCRMLSMVSKQYGMKLSTIEMERLFRSADIANVQSLSVLEVLLLLQQLGLPPVAPEEAEAYRDRLLRTAARSVVSLEGDAALERTKARSARKLRAMRRNRALRAGGDDAGPGENEGDETHASVTRKASPSRGKRDATTVLTAPADMVDEIALLFGRFDGGHKGFLTPSEFRTLKDALAVQSGGAPFKELEHRLLFARADLDQSGSIDLNELFLHLRVAHPASIVQAGENEPTSLDAVGELLEGGGDAVIDAAHGAVATASKKVIKAKHSDAAKARGGGAEEGHGSEMDNDVAEAAAKTSEAQHEEARRRRIDALVATSKEELTSHVRRAFGDSELRAFAGLFTDMDHDGDGALSIQEFRLLLTLLAERSRAGARGSMAAESAGFKVSSTSPSAQSYSPTLSFGLRDVHGIFRQLDLDASAALSFAELLQLLAADEGLGKTALVEAQDMGGKHLRGGKERARKLKKAKQKALALGTAADARVQQAAASPTGGRVRTFKAKLSKKGVLRLTV